MLISNPNTTVKIVKEYLWRAYFMFFALQNTVPDTLKHYVWPPQTVCLTISNILFDNFNTTLSPSKSPHSALSFWPSDNYDKLQNTRIFCPSDFRNGFRGHSHNSKRARNWLVFSLVQTYHERKVIVSVPVNVSLPVIVNVVVPASFTSVNNPAAFRNQLRNLESSFINLKTLRNNVSVTQC